MQLWQRVVLAACASRSVVKGLGFILQGRLSPLHLSSAKRGLSHALGAANQHKQHETSPEKESWGPGAFVKTCASSEDVEALGKLLSSTLHRGDVILLRGDLGAGKTTLSRGIIRGLFEDDDLLVTSPSFLLDNSYERQEDGLSIHHMDLYRLPQGCDLSMLNIPNIYTSSLCLIEWPQRMEPSAMPTDYLDVDLRIKYEDNEARIITLTPKSERWTEKLKRLS